MTNPSLIVPAALPPLLELTTIIAGTGLPARTLDIVRLRVSQLNGRSVRVPGGAGDPAGDEPLSRVADWPAATCFTAAERAALALAEAVTRLADPRDPVPDAVWAEAARHHPEKQLGALVLQIGVVNLWNRVNLATRQTPAELT